MTDTEPVPTEPFTFEINERVVKDSGDYAAEGSIVACFYVFPESKSVPRYVVRHQANVAGFFCHIYNANQLRSIDREVANRRSHTPADASLG